VRTLFFGTPDIAAMVLQALAETTDVAAVVCQPDRPAGRGMKLRPPATKVLATELGIEVAQPRKIRNVEFADWVRAQDADVAVVIAYGRILPKTLLDAPRRGCMNLHASLLPQYRGAAPINWAIVNGETHTGIALMQMDEGMDTGPVYRMRNLAIGPDETAGELYVRLGELAATMVREDLPAAVSGDVTAVPQQHDAATMAPMLKKEDGWVDWTQAARRVHDHIRGMSPWPGAHTTIGSKRFKLLSSRLGTSDVDGEPGTIVTLARDHAVVACGRGSVRLLRGQLEGKKALDAKQLAAGRTLVEGVRLGQ